MNRFFGNTPSKAAVAALLGCALSLMTGCSANQFLSMADNSPVAGASVQGTVHGGQNPVTGAAIQMWSVGASGYGSPATALGPLLATDTSGNFSYPASSYTCPTGSTQVYITSAGGNPGLGTGTNANIMLAAALGNCSALGSGTVINIDEVTTAAAAFALGQYFTPAVGGLSSADGFGAPITTQAQVGIVNAFATVNNLVTTSTGNAVTSATLTANGLTVTATPESAKLNTVADILAACVNSAGGASGDTSACGKLFAAVAPTGGAAPTDTLQAAVYMSLNPTSNNATGSTTNLAALYALVTGTAPYVGVAVQPTDWTIGIQYTGGTTPLNDPQNMAADANGNIWVVNHNSTTSASLTELSGSANGTVAAGTPEVNVSTIGGQLISVIQPRNEAIDTNGNVWLDTTSSSRVLEYNATTPASSVSISPTGGGSPYGVAIDGNNNVFYTHESASATATVEEYLGGVLATTADVDYGVFNPGAVNQQPEFAAIDTAGNLWMTNGSATTGLESNMFQMSAYNGSTACTVFPCLAATAGDTTLTQTYTNMVTATNGVPALSEPWGLAAGSGGVMWTANVTGNTVTKFTSPTAGTDYGSVTSLNKPEYVAVDGAGNLWVSNNTATPGSVSEISSAGTVLSPVNSTAPFNIIGFSHAGIASAGGVTIDPSGNVWVASQVATTGGVFEIVGAAAPTVTPIALALKNGTVGTKP